MNGKDYRNDTAVEFWTVVSFLLTFMGFVGGLPNGCSVKQKNARRHDSPPLTGPATVRLQLGRAGKGIYAIKADLPLNYVRREDYIRGQTVSRPNWTHFTTNWKWYSSTANRRSIMVDITRVRRESLRWSCWLP